MRFLAIVLMILAIAFFAMGLLSAPADMNAETAIILRALLQTKATIYLVGAAIIWEIAP